MSNIGDPEAVAAEYVLGTLDSDEREQARSLLSTDEAFAARVKLWERRLGELHLMVEPVEPDPQLWERVKAKLPQVDQDAQVKPVEPAPPEPAPPEPVASPKSRIASPTIVPAVGPEPPPREDRKGHQRNRRSRPRRRYCRPRWSSLSSVQAHRRCPRTWSSRLPRRRQPCQPSRGIR